MAADGQDRLKVAPTVETLKPYLDRALNDKEFRDDLKEALAAARKLYGPLAKEAPRATAPSSLRRGSRPTRRCRRTCARRSRSSARPPSSLKGKKKSHKGRNAMLLAGPRGRGALQPLVRAADPGLADGQDRGRRRPAAARRVRHAGRNGDGGGEHGRRRTAPANGRRRPPRVAAELQATRRRRSRATRRLAGPAFRSGSARARPERPARARPGTSPLVPRDVVCLEQDGTGRRGDADAAERARRAGGRRARDRTRRPGPAARRSGTDRARRRRRSRARAARPGGSRSGRAPARTRRLRSCP